MERKETKHQVIKHYNDKTEVWEKNSAGCTKEENHRTYHHKSGIVTDHNGKIVGNTKSGGSHSGSSGISSSGGCFLTTACTVAMGLPDDCRELTVLRNFRDKVLCETEQGKVMIAEYYRVAPLIVTAIEKDSLKSQFIWTDIYGRINQITNLVEMRLADNAIQEYATLVRELEAQYLSSTD
ncbi:MAG: CFI-box-CTERM domain-containing protein [Prolixibacteraceae bacterium]|jgi:hypothetical protein|nr:CFI-box-CTERM domain-containing protein [Prolixibacteraceae bacterium]